MWSATLLRITYDGRPSHLIRRTQNMTMHARLLVAIFPVATIQDMQPYSVLPNVCASWQY